MDQATAPTNTTRSCDIVQPSIRRWERALWGAVALPWVCRNEFGPRLALALAKTGTERVEEPTFAGYAAHAAEQMP
jgi:hypothetical protein